MSGHWGKLLRVNLDDNKVSTEELSDSFLRRHIGGAGITGKLLYDEVGADVEPLSPENKLIIAPGLLVGPKVPTASKTAFGFKSPLTGGYGKAIVGGRIGDQLKEAGYDALIIEGKAKKASVLVIQDDDVKVDNAEDMWGKDTHETVEMLKNRYGKVKTAVIGPASEKLSKISMIECDERQAGRGGPGAVMGSKNLKAVAVKGTKDYPIHDQDKLESEANHRPAAGPSANYRDCGSRKGRDEAQDGPLR
ncbi:MAG: aldehyde ferredoxin oxidoreductase N-terminal domain-containing protein [Thermoplasmata archaeon]